MYFQVDLTADGVKHSESQIIQKQHNEVSAGQWSPSAACNLEDLEPGTRIQEQVRNFGILICKTKPKS